MLLNVNKERVPLHHRFHRGLLSYGGLGLVQGQVGVITRRRAI